MRGATSQRPYAGQTIQIAFVVHQDAAGDDTAIWVDDVFVTNN